MEGDRPGRVQAGLVDRVTPQDDILVHPDSIMISEEYDGAFVLAVCFLAFF